MDKTLPKKIGHARFAGKGLSKFDPKPYTAEWYKANVPKRFDQVKATLMETGGFSAMDAEKATLNILRRSETALANIKFDPPSKCPSCGTATNHADAKFK